MSKGFTLIELLVVLTIVSILTATALPYYQQYRARSYDLQAAQDLRNAAVAEEAYYLENDEYLSCSGAQCTTLPGITGITKGVSLELSGGADSFTGTSSHGKGSGKTFSWDSARGGLQRE